MNNVTDQELLRDYVERRSEPAFAELVARHIDPVYSAAMRMVRDAHLAQDVTQGVFAALSQRADQLRDRATISGWLHRTTQNLAANVIRSDVRRRAREQEVAAMNASPSAESEEIWERISPHLDAGLEELSEPDRDALLLRYFERKSAREMATILGTSEQAAQKRVNRAVERLRGIFAARGVNVAASSLTAVLVANAVQASPAGLIGTITGISIFAGSTASTLTTTAPLIAMTTLQKILITGTIFTALGTGIYKSHQVSVLRNEIQTLHLMGAERDDAMSQLAALREENARLIREFDELLKRNASMAGKTAAKASVQLDPTGSAALSWLKKVNLLKQRMEETQGQTPELRFLSEVDWLELANTRLDSESDIRTAMGEARKRGDEYCVKKFQKALDLFMQANQKQWPSEISQLTPYLDPTVDESILQRWQIVPKSTFSSRNFAGDSVITEKSPIDSEFDHRWTIDSPSSAGVVPYDVESMENTLAPVMKAYSAAHEGKEPGDPSQLQSFINGPEQQNALNKLLQLQTNGRGSMMIQRSY